jgi:hypothetical protein
MLKSAARIAFRQATKRNNRPMLMISAVLGAASWARGRAKQPPKLLHREVLQPGERISITVIDPATER